MSALRPDNRRLLAREAGVATTVLSAAAGTSRSFAVATVLSLGFATRASVLLVAALGASGGTAGFPRAKS
jgi:hypothetical protein